MLLEAGLVALVVGTEPMAGGARIVNTHNDSVHLELKPKPFRESFDIVMLDTITHGGLKNYQWVNRPLALIGPGQFVGEIGLIADRPATATALANRPQHPVASRDTRR